LANSSRFKTVGFRYCVFFSCHETACTTDK